MVETELRRSVIPYKPRKLFLPYHKRTQRRAALVAHRRCGKTVACLNDMLKRALMSPLQRGRYAYVAPFLSQGKEAAWDYLLWYGNGGNAIKQANIAELRVTLVNGSTIRIHGADNPDRLRGAYLDGVVLDEYADMRPSVWDAVIQPMLVDRGGWATFIGTPKGRNAFWEIITRAEEKPDEWFSARLPYSEVVKIEPNILDAEYLADVRKDMTPEMYAQEFECSFDAAIRGAYYGKEIADLERQGRITDVPYEPLLPVHTAWDLGIGDATAIWFFQISGNEIRVIDWYQAHGQPLAHYAAVLSARGYNYGDDWVPHDARVRELGTGRTRIETLTFLRRRPRLVPDHLVLDGINAARLSLSHCWFDSVKCRDGIEALRQYRTEFDEKTKNFKDNPRHDWTSHTADAFRYLSMAWREVVPEQATKPDPLQEMLRRPTLDQMIEQYKNEQQGWS